jgi:hypothetical protein
LLVEEEAWYTYGSLVSPVLYDTVGTVVELDISCAVEKGFYALLWKFP